MYPALARRALVSLSCSGDLEAKRQHKCVHCISLDLIQCTFGLVINFILVQDLDQLSVYTSLLCSVHNLAIVPFSLWLSFSMDCISLCSSRERVVTEAVEIATRHHLRESRNYIITSRKACMLTFSSCKSTR